MITTTDQQGSSVDEALKESPGDLNQLSYYEILGVLGTADQPKIEKAFHSRRYYPAASAWCKRHNYSDSHAATDHFRKAAFDAFYVLSKPVLREAYDIHGPALCPPGSKKPVFAPVLRTFAHNPYERFIKPTDNPRAVEMALQYVLGGEIPMTRLGYRVPCIRDLGDPVYEPEAYFISLPCFERPCIACSLKYGKDVFDCSDHRVLEKERCQCARSLEVRARIERPFTRAQSFQQKHDAYLASAAPRCRHEWACTILDRASWAQTKSFAPTQGIDLGRYASWT